MGFKIEWIENETMIYYSDILTADDLIQSASLTLADPRFDLSKFHIGDFSNIQRFDFNEADVKIIATLDKSARRWKKN